MMSLDVYEAMGAVAIKRDDPRKNEKMEAIFTSEDYVGQRKLNGERLGLFFNGHAYGRGYSKYGGRMEKTPLVPHIMEAFKRLPPHISLDSEVLFIPNSANMSIDQIKRMEFVEDFWKCREIMGKKYPDRAVKQQEEEGKLHCFVFDILHVNREPYITEPYEDRIAYLDNLRQYFDANSYIHLVPVVYGSEDKRRLYADCINAGLEGIIGKNLNGKYIPGKKPVRNWVKLKKSDPADVIVLGFEKPSEFTEIVREGIKVLDPWGNPIVAPNRFHENGWFGSIWVGQYTANPTHEQVKLLYQLQQFMDIPIPNTIKNPGETLYLVPVAKVSGMNDDLRATISAKPNEYIGKIMVIEYFEQTASKYYQPRFTHFREDKAARECIWEA